MDAGEWVALVFEGIVVLNVLLGLLFARRHGDGPE